MWLHSDVNPYPDSILHDCDVTSIKVERKTLFFSFNDGFWLTGSHKQNTNGIVLRTGPSEIAYSAIDMEEIGVCLFQEERKIGQTIRKAISFDELAAQVNSGVWVLEIVDEFYNCGGALFCGYIRSDQEPYHTEYQMILRYKAATYHWNELRKDREW